jgi:hypothetical protein
MAVGSKAFVDLVRANLKGIPVPSGYDSFRQKLIQINPGRKRPSIEESPENTRDVGSPDERRSENASVGRNKNASRGLRDEGDG